MELGRATGASKSTHAKWREIEREGLSSHIEHEGEDAEEGHEAHLEGDVHAELQSTKTGASGIMEWNAGVDVYKQPNCHEQTIQLAS